MRCYVIYLEVAEQAMAAPLAAALFTCMHVARLVRVCAMR
jgi:hypothetical protein